MSDPTRLHMRLKIADRALLDRLAARYGMTESGLIRWAIRYLDEHGPLQGRGETVDNYTRRLEEQENAMLAETDDERPAYMWTSDRTQQVDYVRELASELISSQRFTSVSDYADAETYAEAIVTDYLERMAEGREAMPDWWDDGDTARLTQFIADHVRDEDGEDDEDALPVRLERPHSGPGRYLYWTRRGELRYVSDARMPDLEGQQAHYMMDTTTGIVVRFTDGQAVAVPHVDWREH